MFASEVLPSPGGPASSTWSSGSSRRRAASMKTSSCAVTCVLVDEVGQPAAAAASGRGPPPPPASRASAIGSAHRGVDGRPSACRCSGRGAMLTSASVGPRRCAAALPISSSGVSPSAPSSSRSASVKRVAQVHEAVARQRARIVVGLARDRRRRPPRARRPPSRAARRSAARRCACRLRAPPGSASRRRRRSPAAALAGVPPERIAIATLGPIPETEVRWQEEVALLLAREPVQRQRVVARDQVRVKRRLLAAARAPTSASPPRPPAGSRRRPTRSPRGRGGGPGPRREPRRSSDRHLGPGRRCDRVRRRAWPAWQIATASASAAWSDSGGLRQAEQGADHALDLVLGGRRRSADRHLDRLRRVVEAGHAALGGGEQRHASRLADGDRRAHVLAEVDAPRAPARPARARRSARRAPSWIRARRLSSGSSGGASITPPSTALILPPATRTTPKPVFATPGSMPITTIIRSDSEPAPGCLSARTPAASR